MTTNTTASIDLAQLDSLEALARAATLGEWVHRHDPGNPVGVQHGVKLPGEFGTWVCDRLDNADRITEGGVAGERNAAFIAAANPPTVQQLIVLARRSLTSGSPAEPPADIGALQEQSAAWYAVVNVLNEVAPGWQAKTSRGMDSAVAAIRERMSAGAAAKTDHAPEACEDCDGRGLAAAHPVQDGENDAARYRMVAEGEAIERTDEFLADDCVLWACDPLGIFAGCFYGSRLFKPARRKIAAQQDAKGGAQ